MTNVSVLPADFILRIAEKLKTKPRNNEQLVEFTTYGGNVLVASFKRINREGSMPNASGYSEVVEIIFNPKDD